MKTANKKIFIKLIIAALIIGCVGLAVILSINRYVISSETDSIISPQDTAQLKNVDCIIVLGCYVDNGTPSEMLEDRLLQGIDLYQTGSSGKMIMSGDHGRTTYDEVNTMKQFAIDQGVPSEDVFMDHAGFSTYESIYRARDIFQAKKVIIVTQKYHLYRALYIADKLGLEAYGVASDQREYYGQTYRDLREILARNKDFWTTIFQPKPTYLGDVIPVNGNGDETNDK